MNVQDVLISQSKAMYSSWYNFTPNDLLLDCGEGCSLELGSRVYGIKTILLSHGHLDHIMGLPGFFFARSAAKGDNSKPLTIIYPEGDKDIARLREFIDKSFLGPHALKFPVMWKEWRPGDTCFLNGGKWLQCFETKHDSTRLTLGYEVMGSKTRLKDQYRSMDQEELVSALAEHKDEMLETVLVRSVVYTGDTTVQDLSLFGGAELVIHEATFLRAEDMKYYGHSHVDEVLTMLAKWEPRQVVLTHFSTRYSEDQCLMAVSKKAKEMNLPFAVWVQYGRNVSETYRPA